MFRLEIYCPFCGEKTPSFKFYETTRKEYEVVIYNSQGKFDHFETKKSLEIIKEQDALEFEKKSIKKHLDRCSNKDYLSSSALKHYLLD